MEKNIRVSVAMATFNGEKYLKEQINSILVNLNENDEIIISDDGSTDNTLGIINSYNDFRIKLVNGPQNGVKDNFANAIKQCSGEFIFLADQDDIWVDTKVEKILEYFKKTTEVTLIVHDAEVFESNTNTILYNSFFEFRKSGPGIIKNILKNSYIGCCIAFRKELIKYILPMPINIEMHDQWIGVINEINLGKSLFINEKLIRYRRHIYNVSSFKHYKLSKMFKNRVLFLFNLIIKKSLED